MPSRSWKLVAVAASSGVIAAAALGGVALADEERASQQPREIKVDAPLNAAEKSLVTDTGAADTGDTAVSEPAGDSPATPAGEESPATPAGADEDADQDTTVAP